MLEFQKRIKKAFWLSLKRANPTKRYFKSFNKERRCFLKFAHLLSLPTHSKVLYANAFQALGKALALPRWFWV
ncbi:hypothetical protein HMPREF1403_01624 [Helicobacter pylori GAM201Ai]|nr:hypothetical protein HMPREF1403_01624 [Helicobacter pylori GAM201Ai]